MQRLAELDGKYVVVSNQMDAAISADDIFYESKFGDNDYLVLERPHVYWALSYQRISALPDDAIDVGLPRGWLRLAVDR